MAISTQIKKNFNEDIFCSSFVTTLSSVYKKFYQDVLSRLAGTNAQVQVMVNARFFTYADSISITPLIPICDIPGRESLGLTPLDIQFGSSNLVTTAQKSDAVSFHFLVKIRHRNYVQYGERKDSEISLTENGSLNVNANQNDPVDQSYGFPINNETHRKLEQKIDIQRYI